MKAPICVKIFLLRASLTILRVAILEAPAFSPPGTRQHFLHTSKFKFLYVGNGRRFGDLGGEHRGEKFLGQVL